METDVSNAPLAFDGDIGINTHSIAEVVVTVVRETVDFEDALGFTVDVTVCGVSSGVCGNLGATSS